MVPLRSTAAAHSWRLGDESTRGALEARLEDPNEELRAAAAKALEHHKL
jgi:HEAT repeat protein